MARFRTRVHDVVTLNKQIRELSRGLRKLYFDLDILAGLVREFSRLVFDKLALDLASLRSGSPNRTSMPTQDFEYQVVRVLFGRTRAVARFFDTSSVPLVTVSAHEQRNTDAALVGLASRATVYFTRATAQRRLCRLSEAYTMLRTKTDGLHEAIKRLEEDNTVLRHAIAAARDPARPSNTSTLPLNDKTWLRLAEVDLFCTQNHELQATVASQRRMSALSQRRMSFSSTRPRSEIFSDPATAPSWSTASWDTTNTASPSSASWNATSPDAGERLRARTSSTADLTKRMSLLSSRRRSGAAYSDMGDTESSIGLTDTSIAGSVTTSVSTWPSRPRSVLASERYKTYDFYKADKAYEHNV